MGVLAVDLKRVDREELLSAVSNSHRLWVIDTQDKIVCRAVMSTQTVDMRLSHGSLMLVVRIG